MEDLKIRDLKDKAEIDGLVYCIGENEPFSGIFVEKVGGDEIKETYDSGIILKKEIYKRFSTREKVYKMFLVESIIYQNGELLQKNAFVYNTYGELKKEVLFNENIVKYYDYSGNVIKRRSVEIDQLMFVLKIAIPIIILIFLASVGSGSNSHSSSEDLWKAESYLKNNLRDPSSYERIDYNVKKNGEVTIKYRAKNGFGGYEIEERTIYVR